MRIQPHRLNSILRVEFAFVGCVISALLFTPHVWCQAPAKDKTQTPSDTTPTPYKLQGTVEIGAQSRDIQGSHTAKFQEFREVPKGFFVPKLALDFNSVESPYFVSFRGLEVGERDQRYSVDAGKFGKYRSEFVWDQIPHAFGDGTSFLLNTAPGLYQVSPTLRARLQVLTTPEALISPTSEVSNLIRQELQTAPTTEVKLLRDEALFRQSYSPSDRFELHFEFSRVRNIGSRPMSAGTFVRRPVPPPVPVPGLTDIGGRWEGIGQEFLEPIDHRTNNLELGVQFTGRKWNAGVDYRGSLFRNNIDSVIFENPFRVTDEQGCTPNATPPPTLTCGASNRFRQVRWQTDLTPNNDSHTLNLWGHVDLTPHTYLRGLFSLAYWTQDDDFLPWTLNTAITPRDWDGASPITNPRDVGQLPAPSLNGKLRSINHDYALVNRNKNFRLQAEYRAEDVDTQSRSLDFPGYAAFGDSTWRAPATDFYNLPIENLDWDYRHQIVTAGFQWEILRNLTWNLDYGWDIWNRKFRDVNRNNDHSIRNRLEVTTDVGLKFRADYRYSNRQATSYNTQPLSFNTNFAGSPPNGPTTAWEVTRFTVMKRGLPIEFNLLRRFDESNRILNDGRFTIELIPRRKKEVTPTPAPAPAAAPAATTPVAEPQPSKLSRTNFSASYRYLSEAYDKDFYGRTSNLFSIVDTQFSYAFLNGSFFFASYSHEMNRYGYRDLAHLLPNPQAPPGAIVQGVLAQFPTANTWERTSRSSLDSFELGINAAPFEGKMQLDISYALSFARDRISTVNPYTVRADSVLHAGANPYPDTVVRRQDVNVAISRKIKEGLEVGARYWYEPYTQDDFSFNVLQPYTHGTVTSDTPKYLFQDARYASYHSNVFSVFVRYSFGANP